MQLMLFSHLMQRVLPEPAACVELPQCEQVHSGCNTPARIAEGERWMPPLTCVNAALHGCLSLFFWGERGGDASALRRPITVASAPADKMNGISGMQLRMLNTCSEVPGIEVMGSKSKRARLNG